MPIAFDPTQTRPFALRVDRDKPVETRPVFLCRAVTRREKIKHRELAESLTGFDGSDDDFYGKLIDHILTGVTGWRNVRRPGEDHDAEFSREGLESVLTDQEIIELFRGWPTAWDVTEADAGESTPPAPSGAEQSAPNA